MSRAGSHSAVLSYDPPVTEAQLRYWLDRYGRAFVDQDAEAGASLFAEKGTYQWGPFGELLVGPEAIRRKWAEQSDPAAEERFDYEVLAATEEIGIARWIASSRLPPGPATQFDGIFAVRLNGDGLCTEFREWWNSREEPGD
jgi:hypothetical protein